MKKKFALLLEVFLILLLVGCGGSNAGVEGDAYAGNNASNNNISGDYYSYNNVGDDTAGDAPSYSYSPNQPAATPVPIGSHSGDAQPSNASDDESYIDAAGYTSTAYDTQSTFGIDVDTASYTQAKNYIESGVAPPPDSIRVEEFINYFESGYPTPEDVVFGLFADGAPSPFEETETYLLRFGIQGYDIPEENRKPLALTFVIDVSGSMDSNDKLGLVKRSLHMLVDRLRPDDTVGIVIFGSRARVVLSPTSGANQALIHEMIDWLSIDGSTNAEEGLRMGYNLAFENFNSRGVNRVILCSDGVANVGQTKASQLLKFIEDYADIGITLTATGFGMGTYDDDFMEELADHGDGNYAYVDDIDEAERLFVDDLTSTLMVIAKDAKIQIEFNRAVVSHFRLMGYENRQIADEDFRDDTVDAGELGAGHSVTALYAVRLQPGAEGVIATMRLRWEDPDTGEVVEISGQYNTWDLNAEFFDASPHFQLAVVAAQFAEILRGGPDSLELEIQDLLPYMYITAAQLTDDQQVSELTTLMIQADLLDE
jgi:Ca-activated chloride channel family protein